MIKEDFYKMSINFIDEILGELKELKYLEATHNVLALRGFILMMKRQENQNPNNNYLEIEEMKINGIKISKNTNCNTWYARFRINSKKFYLSGSTQKEVATQLKATLKNNPRVFQYKRKNVVSFYDWYLRWLEIFKQRVSPTTKNDYEKSMKHIGDDFRKRDIKNISAIEVMELLNGIEKSRSRQKVFQLLYDIFNKAYIHEVVDKNIMLKVQRPIYVANKGIALNTDKQKLFIHECQKDSENDIYLVMLYQGMRPGEALALEYKDFDFKNKTITINKAIEESGKTIQTKGTSKGYGSDRVVPCFDRTLKLIKKYKGTTGRIFPQSYKTYAKK